MPVPATTETRPAQKTCASCGAPVAFDPGSGALKCAYCSTTQAIDATVGVPRHGLTEPPPVGVGAAGTRTMRCTHCGATAELDAQAVATKCAFCASPLVEADQAATPAEGVVPFAVTREDAGKRFSAWLKGLWFRPSDLKRLADLKEMRGIYVPSWIFDANAQSSWTAEAGYTYYETETTTDQDGNTTEQQVERIRWEPVSGEHSGSYSDLIVSGSKGLGAEELENIGPFTLEEALFGFNRDFLAGFEAEAPAVQPAEAWVTANKWIDRFEYQACDAEVPGDTHRFLNVSTRTTDEVYRSALLPLFIGAYAYAGKIFRVLVNGRTGETKGQAPWSFWKIAGFTLFLLAIVAAVYLFLINPQLGHHLLHHARPTPPKFSH